MDQLAMFQERILENQKKLDEIAAKRKEVEEELRKRKLEEEKEEIKRREEEDVRKKRKLLNLSKAACTIATKNKVLSMKLVQFDTKVENLPSTVFRQMNSTCLVLCIGLSSGKIQALDVLNSFSSEITIDIKADHPIYSMEHINTTLIVPKDGKKTTPPTKVDGNSFLVVGAGCDLILINLFNWSRAHCVEDAHESEVQSIKQTNYDNKHMLFTGSLDQTVRAWNPSTWECYFVLKGHTDAIVAVQIFPGVPENNNRAKICSSSDDSTIRIWDIGNCLEQAGSEKEKFDIKKSEEKKSKEESVGPVISKSEYTISLHEDFVNNLCVVHASTLGELRGTVATGASTSTEGDEKKGAVAEQEPKDAYFLVSASGDFSIRVWNSSWQCVRVLDSDKFVAQLISVGPTLFSANRTGVDFDECQLETYQVNDPNPLRWGLRNKSLNILLPSAIVAQTLDLSRFSTSDIPANGRKMAMFLATSAEEECKVHVWTSPFRCKESINLAPAEVEQPSADWTGATPGAVAPPTVQDPLQLKSPALPDQTPATKEKEGNPAGKAKLGSSALPPPISDAGLLPSSVSVPTNDQYPGDQKAKRFLDAILHLENLSPDMRRLVTVCLQLHST